MKLSLTVAASKLPPEYLRRLPGLLDSVLTYARSDSQIQTAPGLVQIILVTCLMFQDWEMHIKDLMGRLYRISTYTSALESGGDNWEQQAEIIRSLAHEYDHRFALHTKNLLISYSIDLRVRHLQQLSKFHESRENWLQLALCNITTAAVIAQVRPHVDESHALVLEDEA